LKALHIGLFVRFSGMGDQVTKSAIVQDLNPTIEHFNTSYYAELAGKFSETLLQIPY
jgi:hypothetical protein